MASKSVKARPKIQSKTPPQITSRSEIDASSWWMKSVRVLAYIVGAGFWILVPLLMWLGYYSRYVADDFCFAQKVHQFGMVGAQKYWYQNFQGCFTLHFVMDMVSSIGPITTRWMPTLLLLLWLMGLSWATTELTSRDSSGSKLFIKFPSLLVAGLMSVATLLLSPALGQSFLWENGALRYLAPLMLGTFHCALVAHWLNVARASEVEPATVWVRAAIIHFLLAFVAGGFNEIYMLLQVMLVLCITIAAWRIPTSARRQLLIFCAAGLAGAVLTAIIVIIAPGNAMRQASLPHPPGLMRVLEIAQFYYVLFLARIISAAPWLLGCGAVFGFASKPEAALAIPKAKWRFREALLVLLGGLVLVYFCYVPTSYALSGQPPYRAVITPTFIFVCTMVGVGYIMGLMLRDATPMEHGKTSPSLALGVLFSYGLAAWWLWSVPVGAAQGIFATIPEAKARAELWDQRDQSLRAAHANSVARVTTSDVPNVWGLEGLNRDPAYWTNQCIAGYYGVQTVTVAQ